MQETCESPPADPVDAPGAGARPLLIYDGECGFCGYWVRYWQALTGDTVKYRSYQDAAADYPEITIDAFRRAVQYIAPDGRRAAAAEASFLTLAHAPGRAFWLWLYRHLPGFAFASELAYAFIARHRPAFYRVSLLLWGRDHRPPRYDLVAFLFLRLFGLIYLSAFVSFALQARGLIGSHGILPLAELVNSVAGRVGTERFYLLPMVFWLDASDTAIQAVCWAGAVLSLLLVFNVLPRLSLALLYVLYLSLIGGGQAFMTYQWDIYLVEAGFAALLMTFAQIPGIWLLRFLLFRFMFMSGWVKLSSGDPNWRSLTALSYHFLTQPLPTPIAWYAAQLPSGVLRFVTGAMFFIEIVLPPLIFFPRKLRFVAAFGILLLQVSIFLTGNYNWFNLQTMLLCLLLFDDRALGRILPQRLISRLRVRPANLPAKPVRMAAGALTVLIVFCGLVQMSEQFGSRPPAFARAVVGAVEPLHIVNSYGVFAVMTTQRNEIVIEGSGDGVIWSEYGFRYKPGELTRGPRWNVPGQPRLDWQMWFAALSDPRRLPWFWNFLGQLLRNQPAVTALLDKNPFPDAPPIYVRARFFEYSFADGAEKAQGIWWRRRLVGIYFPAASLSGR